MRLSVLVITREGGAEGFVALSGLRAALAPGDEVIVLDEGSSDGTAELLETMLAEEDLGPEITRRAVLLGCAPPESDSGASIRLGLEVATRDALLILRGTDSPLAEGISAARHRMAENGASLLLGRALPLTETAPAPERVSPADPWRLLPALPPETLALALASLPGRCLLRRSWLLARGLPSPKPVSDEELHWQLCLAAGPDVELLDTPLARIAVAPSAQPLTSLAGFGRLLPQLDGPEMHAAGLLWLILRMERQIPQLTAAERWPYAQLAATGLAGLSAEGWSRLTDWLGDAFRDWPVLAMATALRKGDVAATVAAWTQEAEAIRQPSPATLLAGLQERMAAQEALIVRLQDRIEGLARIAEYRALSAFSSDREGP